MNIIPTKKEKKFNKIIKLWWQTTQITIQTPQQLKQQVFYRQGIPFIEKDGLQHIVHNTPSNVSCDDKA